MPSQEASSTMLLSAPTDTNTGELKTFLEKGDTYKRIETLKRMIALQLNGESMQPYIMTVMKYCCPEQDHTMKKLLLYFWEVVDKQDAEGKSLPEMIMLCAFIRADLQHPNEFVRGMTLRFLCKLKERDLFEPLVSAVVQNLTHRVSYVRRNAVLAVHTIFAHCPELLPDAPELIEKFLLEENDVSARRNAFNMLVECAEDRAMRFLTAFRESHDVTESGDVFQIAVIDFIKNSISKRPQDKARYIPLIFAVMQSPNPAVAYQCATTLLRLSSSPTALKHAAGIYTNLLATHSDSNVRLIALGKLKDMRRDFPEMLQEVLMEIVRSMATASLDLRSQVLELCLNLVTTRTVEPFVQAMKKELARSQSDATSSGGSDAALSNYRQLIVKAIHTAVSHNLHMAPAVIPIMLDHVCEPGASSCDVITFVRDVMQQMPDLCESVLERLVGLFPSVTSPKVLRSILWLFGIHCRTAEQIATIVRQLKASIAPFPLMPATATENVEDGDATTTIMTTTVREDGTYGTSIQLVKRGDAEQSAGAGLRAQIIGGDYFLAATLANTLGKLVVNFFKSPGAHSSARSEIQADALEVMHELVRFGTARYAPSLIDNDSHERIRLAITVAQNPNNAFLLHIAEDSYEACRDAMAEAAAAGEPSGSNNANAVVRADQPLIFSQLTKNLEHMSGAVAAAADDILAAVSNETIDNDGAKHFMSRLQRVRQLSGFSDPVYIEATVTVHHFDVLLEWLIINQTKDTLTNLCVEIAAVGDMRLTERPQYLTIAPFGQATMRTALKVSSTETGIVYGSCLYDVPGATSGAASERRCVILNEITVDILDYIKPATCPIADFRSMWGLFEWENKIVVNTDITDLWEFVERVESVTGLRAIEPQPEDDCPYLSCSLYARSVFGEDALANISLERHENSLEGVVRIRSKTQAIALGLGEKLSKRQRLSGEAPARS